MCPVVCDFCQTLRHRCAAVVHCIGKNVNICCTVLWLTVSTITQNLKSDMLKTMDTRLLTNKGTDYIVPLFGGE